MLRLLSEDKVAHYILEKRYLECKLYDPMYNANVMTINEPFAQRQKKNYYLLLFARIGVLLFGRGEYKYVFFFGVAIT